MNSRPLTDMRDALSNLVQTATIDKLAAAGTHLDFTKEAAVAADAKPVFPAPRSPSTMICRNPFYGS